MAREMRLPKDLQPEQLDILNRATVPNPDEFIFVQGVAGSGKTTIALNIARKVGELNAGRPIDSRQTILFLTYNDRLAEYCRNTLANISAITNIIAPNKNQVLDGSINVMTVSDLFRLSVNLQVKSNFLSDDECIRQIANIAVQRNILDLLPSQIFSLIATFLRGRPELLNKTIDELNTIIDRDIHKSIHYRMYGESLQEIRRRLLSTYESWKRKNNGIDRSDVAKSLRDKILKYEEYLKMFPNLQAEHLRKISKRKLGDGDIKTYQPLEWADKIFETLQDIPKMEGVASTFREILGKDSVKQHEIEEMYTAIYSSIQEYGLRATPTWEPIGSHLRSPLIIVDEIQDLSPVECENLISLWFQMARSRESHLILLGDLNQQITPSGFEWGTLHELIKGKAELYNHEIDKPFIADLNNNYRTTEEIASFVHSVMSNVAPKALADEEIAQRFLRYSINPNTTLPIGLQDKINQVKREDGDLVPHVLVGGSDLFKDGLNKYAETLKGQEHSDEINDKLLSTVIITEHGNQVDDLIYPELRKHVIENDFIEVIPVLSCKGLEFDRCVLYGLSIKNLGEIEQDLISRWYTSFTRAKLQLLIYLTQQEFEFMRRLGWDNISADVVLVKKVTSADQIVDELVRLGKTDLDDDVLLHISEAQLSRFIQTGNEDLLQNSLRKLKQAELMDRYFQAAWQGAEWFEKKKNYLKAADYYREAMYPIEEVRCLTLHAQKLESEGISSNQIKEFYSRAKDVTESVSSFEMQAKCWLLLQEYDKALSAASHGGDKQLQQDIASQVADSIKVLASEKPENAKLYAELLEENGYSDAAALSWLSLAEWERAFVCVKKSDKTMQDVIAKQACALALEAIKKKQEDAIVIASKLDENKYHEEAATIWLQARIVPAAIQSLVDTENIEKAEKTLNELDYKIDVSEKSKAHIILGKGFLKDTNRWPKAYYYFDLAHENNECRRLEQLCRNAEDFRTLVDCYHETRDFEKIRKLANELDLLENSKKELIAECWQLSEEWERAATVWMKLFFDHIERFEMLMGPKPDKITLHPSSRGRFDRNIEANRIEYNLQLTDWEILARYTSNQREFYGNVAKTVSIISMSEKWQEEMSDFWKVFRDRVKSATKSHGDTMLKVRLPSKGESIRPDTVAELWNKFDTANEIFQQRAVNVSRECFKVADKLLAIQIMNSICKWQNEAEKMSVELSLSDTELWIKSWKVLEYTSETIEKKIFNLHPINDAALIHKAIQETYQDNAQRRKTLREKYRDKLINHKNKHAQEVLIKYFPEYIPPKGSLEKSLHSGQLQVSDLIKELVGGLSEWSLQAGDQAELSEQLESMLDMIEKQDRLSAKWKMAKSIIPDTLKPETKVAIERLDELIRNPKGISLGSEQKAQAVFENTSKVQESPKTPPEKQKGRTRHPIKAEIQHKVMQIIDLHDFSLDDAEREFESTFTIYSRDKSVGALLIIHGYGKDKSPSVIKEWLDNRSKRLRQHKHVKHIIKGEEIADPFDEKANLIRKAVDDLEFSQIGPNNRGVTIIVFDRK